MTAILVMAAVAAFAASRCWAASPASECQAIADPASRLRCYESLESQKLPEGSPPTAASTVNAIGEWRLMRTSGLNGGREAISISRGAELYGSDPDFAGLMLKCADDDFDVLLVLLRPFKLAARPLVSIDGQRVEATVLVPGTMILLPKEVARSAKERWQSMPNLSLAIDQAGTLIKGLVSLDGFEPAREGLMAACATRR